MGKLDTITKDYMRNNPVFADACNYFIYGDRQIIDPKKLQELDPTEIAVPSANGKEDYFQKFRDVLRTTTVMKPESAGFRYSL